ncbi:putative phage tail assembly chaperone (plasmid) [Xylella fastidiosa subsp. pauca]
MALGTLLSHLGDPAVTEIEALVFEQTAIKTPRAPPTDSAATGSTSTSTPAAPICCAS